VKSIFWIRSKYLKTNAIGYFYTTTFYRTEDNV